MYKYSDEVRELLYEASEIIISEMDCYKKRSDTYVQGMEVAKKLKKMVNEEEG